VPHVEVNGQRLHYVRRGAGEPLLLIMGMAGTQLSWGDPFLELLERDFDLVAYDHRGIGQSAPLVGSFSIADLADDAAALLAALELTPAHVLGISMGGMVAQELVLRHPDAVRDVVLGCTYAGGEGSALSDPALIQELALTAMSGNRDAAIRAGWHANVSAAHAADEASFARFRDAALDVPAALPTILAQLQAIATHDTSARLGEVAVPALVVHGTEDRMIPVANARAIADRIPGAKLEIWDDIGHLFFWEQPERAAELVRGFFGAGAAPGP